MKLNIFLAVCLITASFSLSACETVKGIGKDLENAGESVQDVFD
ncbi:MAG: entericidin A/B family lipoprotein [Pseudomonadota bacterium]